MQRSLSQEEQHIISLAENKFGKSEKKTKSFFLTQVWQSCNHGWKDNEKEIWINLSNLAAWLVEGILSEDEIKETQM